MTPRERVLSAFEHREADRVPLMEPFIPEALVEKLGCKSLQEAIEALGLDGMIYHPQPLRAFQQAARNGMDPFGRKWKKGFLVEAMAMDEASLPAPALEEVIPAKEIQTLQQRYPSYPFFLLYEGPFFLSYTSLGMERFAIGLKENQPRIETLLRKRAEHCLQVFKKAEALGFDGIVMAEDVAYSRSTFIAPEALESLLLPLYREFARELAIPIIWHSDGSIEPLIPMLIEAGIKGLHPLDPMGGMNLATVKKAYGDSLVLMGNMNCLEAMLSSDTEALFKEVDRCLLEGARGGGFILSTSHGLIPEVEPEGLVKMFDYAKARGVYPLSALNIGGSAPKALLGEPGFPQTP